MGVYEPKSAETLMVDYEGNLNQETTIEFLKDIAEEEWGEEIAYTM
jgi:hypothetical protein